MIWAVFLTLANGIVDLTNFLRKILQDPTIRIPVLVWAGFVLIMGSLLTFGPGKYLSALRTLIQWDGQHYLSIARDGYEMFPCGFDASSICGNIGWFPMYSIIGKIVSLGIIELRIAMLATSWLSLLGAMLLLFRWVNNRFDQRTALFSLLALVLFPGSFYFLTAFPYSLYLLLAMTVFFLLDKKRYGFIWIPAGLLAVTYPSGILIGLPILWELVTHWRKLSSGQRLQLVAGMFAIGMALILLATYFWYRFDDFWLYNRFQAQPHFAHEMAFPLMTFIKSFELFAWDSTVNLMILFVTFSIALFYTRRIPVGWQLFMFGVLLFTPTFGTTTCYYRHVVVAFPLFVMVGIGAGNRWRRYLFGAYAIASIILMWTVYLRMYKAGNLM